MAELGGGDEVTEFLSNINLSQYADVMKDEGAECLDDLKSMDKEGLEEFAQSLSMKKLHRIKFVKACLALKDAAPTPNEQKQQHRPMKQQQFGFGGMGAMGGVSDGINNINEMMANMMNEQQDQFQKIQQMQQQFSGAHSQQIPQQQQRPMLNVHARHNMNMHPQHKMQQQPAKKGGSKAICGQCGGCGFEHQSKLKHKWPDPERRCLFCSDCKGCGAKGWVPSNGTVSISHCPPCEGRGWIHDSSHQHRNGDPKKKCFWCSDCKICRGSGKI